jgi:antitoxin MazE
MRSHIRKIGNSRGIIIPAALLEACELGEEVNLRMEGKTLIIEALKSPRSGWFDGYQPEIDADAWESFPVDDDTEWVW